MTCVQLLDERAPDYDQALGELAAAIQRMALLQALPDLRGEDEEQDQALAALAASFAPEDLQLLYQIAIMTRARPRFCPGRARRDSRWRCSGCWRSGRSHRGVRPRRPARRAGPRGRAASPAGSTATGAARRRAPSQRQCTAPTAATGDWACHRCRDGAAGPAGQLAAHCVLVGRAKDIVKLRLDRAGETSNRAQIDAEAGRRRCRSIRGEPVRLEIGAGETGDELTPARQQAHGGGRAFKAAEQAIDERSCRARDARHFRRDGAAGLRPAAELNIHLESHTNT